jgi:hypothetical protein
MRNFDMYKIDSRGSAISILLGTVHSYRIATFEIGQRAARGPGDYLIVNRQTGDRTVLSFGLTVDGRHDHVTPISQQASAAQSEGTAMKKPSDPEAVDCSG